jgi:hypothetical protein
MEMTHLKYYVVSTYVPFGRHNSYLGYVLFWKHLPTKLFN